MIQLFAGHPEHRRGTPKNSANNYLPSALAALRIGDHRETSDLTKLANFAGERSSFFGREAPRSASLFFTAESSSDASRLLASLSMTFFGVPLGANMPAQMLIS